MSDPKAGQPHAHHEASLPHSKKAKTKCEKCQQAECQCQTGCCGGACPHCTF